MLFAPKVSDHSKNGVTVGVDLAVFYIESDLEAPNRSLNGKSFDGYSILGAERLCELNV
jgi:hypothetical protein